jgi:hypothetical protein
MLVREQRAVVDRDFYASRTGRPLALDALGEELRRLPPAT